MDTGLLIFLLIGAAILVAALLIGRVFARPLNRQMPGADEGDSRAWWYGAGRRGKDGDPPDLH